jgi:carbamoyl-phosphate synthase small subunit
MKPSTLILENNTVFSGRSPSWQKDFYPGEVVFTTGMTGYVESLTDPSYAGQILTFTYPLIGNYGVSVKSKWESRKIWTRGVVVGEACENWSHHEGKKSLLDWLEEQKVPIITGVDTRALTKLLRERGVMLGAIASTSNEQRTTNKKSFQDSGFRFQDPNKENLVAEVSIKKKKVYGSGRKKLIAVDCGMKENIIRELLKFKWEIHRVPYDYDYTKEKWDAVFVSNGPGDPKMASATVEILKKTFKLKKPVFGICLGSQLMALAAGAKTYKLPYGHRGQNQPCQDTKTRQCIITSQNHGYAVRKNSIPQDWEVSFRNLNDNSIEGIAHKRLPFFSVQFHPEAAPGPTDPRGLFKEFYSMMKSLSS